ncbi:MAG: ATP-binding protein [Bacteroidales bacterium]|nr:ATP-binding protein [Bacteroidales bacterium]
MIKILKNLLIRYISRISIALLSCLLLSGGEVLGQRYLTRTYSEADGLANSTIYSVAQDSSGVIWIGRRGGISCYDGTHFTNFSSIDGTQLISYTILLIDEKEQLWAVPESGPLTVLRYNGKKWEKIPTYKQVPVDFQATYNSLDVYYDKGDLVILVGTVDNGFFRYSKKQWKHFTNLSGIPDRSINSVRGFEGNIFIASEKGLMVLHDDIHPPVQVLSSPLLSGDIYAIERKGNCLWALGSNWIGHLSGGNFKSIATNFQRFNEGFGRPCFLHIGRNGKLLFGNLYKVNYYDQASNSMEVLDHEKGLISEGGTSALVDREMNIWITGYRGITKISAERFVSFFERDGLYSNEVSAAIEASPGSYVFGHDGGLTFYNGKKMLRYSLDPLQQKPKFQARVLDIQKDIHGNLWLAANSLGLARLDKSRNITWYGEKQGLMGFPYSVAFTPSNELYVGTTSGFFKFDKDRFIKIDLGKTYNNRIRKVFITPNGSIYIATIGFGLVKMNESKFTGFISPDNKLANNVFAFIIDSKKRQLVGTAAGLFELKNHDLMRVNRGGFMIDKPVYLIFEDHQTNLWFGTDNGIYRWNGKKMDHFTMTDGLAGQEINRAAGFIDSKNHLWFGTSNGLTQFRPEFDYKSGEIPPPKVQLLSAGVDKDSVDPYRNMKFPYGKNDLIFQTRVISLINEQQIFVKYFLEGYDTGWSNEQLYTKSNFIFNNLRPGSYRFYLKARNSVGIWSDPVISATFVIRPPFWASLWVLSFALLLFSCIIFLTARFIIVNRYKNRLQEQVNLRTIELKKSEQQLKESNAAKDSFFSIIAHDLRSPFNVILGYLDLLTSEESDYTETEQKQMLLKLKSASVRTIDLLDNLLTWARTQRGALPFEPEMFSLTEVIADNIGLFDMSVHSKKITLTAKSSSDLQVFADRNMIDTVIRNLISNAIKFTFPGGKIIIGMELQDLGNVLVFVKDDGMGIPAWLMEKLFKIEQRTVVKGTANETGTGLGLILCKEFIEKNNGRIWVESKEGNGSTFFFVLPGGKSIPGKLPVL